MSKLAVVTRAIGKASLHVQKASPSMLFVVGLAGVGVGTVLACKSTLQVEGVITDHLKELQDVDSVVYVTADPETDKIKDKARIYASLVFDLGKLYGPAIIIGGIGVACLTGSHRMLSKRNAALTAAYAVLERSYNAYRENVREAIGEDRERELHYLTEKKLADKDKEIAGLSNKKGPKKDYSQYAKFFDEANPNWTRSPEKNMSFLHLQQNIATDILRAKGYILLNDVYDMLGIPRTTPGCVVGWTTFENGDGYVDFGIFNHHTDELYAFVNGVENSVLLDFNVDGVVYDKIER